MRWLLEKSVGRVATEIELPYDCPLIEGRNVKTKAVVLTKDAKEWFDANIGGEYGITYKMAFDRPNRAWTFWFMEDRDAVIFQLQWT